MPASRQTPSPPPAYELQEAEWNRRAVAAEEGRPASPRRSRTAEPGGRKLAWIKATFALVVVTLILVVAAVCLGVRLVIYS